MTRIESWTRGCTAGALALGALLGCQDPYYAPCASNAGCAEGYACVSFAGNLACVPPCATDEDCEIVATRGEVYCTAVGGCAVACAGDADCPANATCDAIAGACVGRGE